MFYRGLNQVGEYCGRLVGRSSYFYHSPWTFLIWVLVAVIVVVLAVIVIKAVSKKNGGNDDLMEMLKSKYISGEIDEEEYLLKKKMLKK
jgi:uncharacterized membrane protein